MMILGIKPKRLCTVKFAPLTSVMLENVAAKVSIFCSSKSY